MLLSIISSTSSSSPSSSKSSLRSRILNKIRNLTTSTDSFNRPTLDQYCSNNRSDLRALILHDETSQHSLQQDGQQSHEDEHLSHGSDAHCCQEIDSDSIFFSESKTHRKNYLSSGRRFFTQTLRLTLCAVILLTVLPCGQGAPITEQDNLVCQENLARRKRFIVPLITGAIWGWLTGPVFVPSPYHHSTEHPIEPLETPTRTAPGPKPNLSVFSGWNGTSCQDPSPPNLSWKSSNLKRSHRLHWKPLRPDRRDRWPPLTWSAELSLIGSFLRALSRIPTSWPTRLRQPLPSCPFK